MKKLLYVFALFSVALLAACSDPEPRYRIGLSQCSDDAWRTQMNNEIMREARLYEGVEVQLKCAHDDNRQQAADIRELIKNGIDLLIVAPNQSDPITPVVEEVYKHGIPVVVIDRRIDSDQYTAYVGGDNHSVGEAAARYIASQLKGKGKVIELQGLQGSSPQMERHRGFMEAMAGYPGIEIVASVAADWMQDVALQKMDSLLRTGVTADYVYAHNDPMAEGAYQAVEAFCRRQPFGEMSVRPELRFVGTDAIPGFDGGLNAIEQRRLEATFAYPTGGDRAVQVAMSILSGMPFERETLLSTVLVNQDNVEVMQMQAERISQLDTKIEALGTQFNDYLLRFDFQRTLLYFGLALVALLIGLLTTLYIFFRTKNRKNLLLQQQKETLTEQKSKLESQKQMLENQTKQLISQKGELIAQKGQLEEQTDYLMKQTNLLIEKEQQLKEATQAKLTFFTNVSHDFRTPLTLIEGPIDQLMADSTQSSLNRQLLLMMKRNVHILLRLVNQILDFRKIENGCMEVRRTAFRLEEHIRLWSESFRIALRRRHIKLALEVAPKESFLIQADAEQMERVFFNLMGNALKYTPDGGSINICLWSEGDWLHYAVTNSGSRLTPEEAKAVFERFYQADNAREGTGIGLALVRAFVELHDGTIEAGSDERGTTFTVTLPLYHGEDATGCQEEITDTDETTDTAVEAYVAEDFVHEDTTSSALDMGKSVMAMPDAELTPLDAEIDPDAPSVLIIDDNADIRNFLKLTLSANYRVLTAEDGEQGLKLARKFVPDVVVSDVMMPRMDGRECCRRLKNDVQTSHIPVILLTACSAEEQRIEGYDCGADSYIAKPFSTPLLLARIQNLIAGRQQLKQLLADNRIIDRADISDLDRDFTTRFRRLIEERMGDSDLNVEELGRELGMSRVQLYRKVKQLTNFSPVEILRQMRLKRATSLLTVGEMSISEIAYEVGFSSPSYFTKCYREEFGVSPSEVGKK